MSSPSARALLTACVRLLTPSLLKMLCEWTLTVPVDNTNFAAISEFDKP